VQGICYAPPTTLVPSAVVHCDLAVDAQTVYWADADLGVVGTAAKAAAPLTPLAFSGEVSPHAIVGGAGRAYWIAGRGPTDGATVIRTWNGGYPSTVVTPPDGVGGLALSSDGQFLYFSTGNVIERIEPGSLDGRADAATGGDVIATESVGDVIGAIAFDGSKLVAAVAGRFVDVFNLADGNQPSCTDTLVDPDAGAFLSCTRLARGSATNLAVAPGVMYWTDGDLVRSNETVRGGAAATLAVFDSPVTGLAVTGGNLYLIVGTAILRQAATPGATPVVFADDGTRPSGLSSDADGVYWAEGGCQILRSPP